MPQCQHSNNTGIIRKLCYQFLLVFNHPSVKAVSMYIISFSSCSADGWACVIIMLGKLLRWLCSRC